MHAFSSGLTLLGGLGLFLLGMHLMTEGLKLAAGHALSRILADWTRNRLRGLVSGFAITGLVQSSSAVTVATIGFANAGLLTLEQAVWVIFGSNVGTTMTGWIVALIGFKLNVEAFAVPLVGIGMLLQLTGERSRRAAAGQALVGFGLLFMGIGVLKEVFDVIGGNLTLPGTAGGGLATAALYVLIGVLLTTLMQSSSAAMVVALSAAEGELIPLSAAAAVVIGANLGTTTTVMLAAWRATPTARRVAASHVLFNVLTTLVAIIILVPMLGLVGWVQAALGLAAGPAVTLAVFHTAFNVLGVLLMIPIAQHVVDWLQQRFRTVSEAAARPRYLDKTVVEVPDVAFTALLKELQRLAEMSVDAMGGCMGPDYRAGEEAGERHASLQRLGDAISDFVAQMGRRPLPNAIAEALPEVLATVQNHLAASELMLESAALREGVGRVDDEALRSLLQEFGEAVTHAIVIAAGTRDAAALETLDAAVEEMNGLYDRLRAEQLRAGAAGRLSVVDMEALLRHAALTRRAVRQLVKGLRRLIPMAGPGDAGMREGPDEAAPAVSAAKT